VNDPRPAAASTDLQSIRSLATIIGSQTAVLVAVLFYYGWASSAEAYRYFGVDMSLLSFSVQDLVLRSVDPAFGQLLSAALIFLVAGLGHHWAVAHDEVVRLRALAAGAGAAGLAVGVLGVEFAAVAQRLHSAVPACLLAGTALLVYADHLSDRVPNASSMTLSKPARLTLTGLAVLATFWLVALAAQRSGHARAEWFQGNLEHAPSAVLYSTQRQAIPESRGVHEEQLADARHPYRYQYRYTGLRLLTRSGGSYVLVPVGWARGKGGVITVPSDSQVRLDLLTARGSTL
jgi:hypothetical protein